jgi:nucleoside-diphosphate-sugar epimerase
MNVLAKLNLWLSGLFSYRPMLTPGKVRELTQDAWICDNTALTNASGWTPSTTLEQGIRLTFARNNQA